MSFIDTCDHSYIENGSCSFCGLVQSSSGSYIDSSDTYNNTHSYSDNKLISFEKDLSTIDLPDEIKQAIIIISSKNSSIITRKIARKRALFAYAYLAYIRLGYMNDASFNPLDLARRIGLEPSEFTEALKLVSGTSLNPQVQNIPITVPIVVISPVVYLSEIIEIIESKYEEFKFDKEYLTKLMVQALAKDPRLNHENPRIMAIALVRYQADILIKLIPGKLKLRISNFHLYVGMTAPVMKKKVKLIETALK